MIFKNISGAPVLEIKNDARLIALEGIDGSGKTTQARLLAEYFEKSGVPCFLTKEPTEENDSGRQVRRALRGEIELSEKERQALFTEDRRHHLECGIVPALRLGRTVVVDRYLFSTIAYGALECDGVWLREISSDFPLPSLTIFIDVSPKWAVRNVSGRGEALSIYEKTEKLERITANYRRLAEEIAGISVISGERSVAEVHKDIVKAVVAGAI